MWGQERTVGDRLRVVSAAIAVSLVGVCCLALVAPATATAVDAANESDVATITAEVSATEVWSDEASRVSFNHDVPAGRNLYLAVNGQNTTATRSTGPGTETVQVGSWIAGVGYPLDVTVGTGGELCTATIPNASASVPVCAVGSRTAGANETATFERAPTAAVTAEALWNGAQTVQIDYDTPVGAAVDLAVAGDTSDRRTSLGNDTASLDVGTWFAGTPRPLTVSAATGNQTCTGTIEPGANRTTLDCGGAFADGDSNDSSETDGCDGTGVDTDEDGLTDCQEAIYGTDPTVADTDGDGFPDGPEVDRTELLPGADPTYFDVFVEVDRIGERPISENGYEALRTAFADAPVSNPNGTDGIELHVIRDERVEKLDGNFSLVSYYSTYADPQYQCAGYHWGLVADENLQPGLAGLGMFGAFSVFPVYAETRPWIFMHELGHSLGLTPSQTVGVDSTNYTYAAYPSVMNYNTPRRPGYLDYSDGTNSAVDHDDWEYVTTDGYQPGWQGGCQEPSNTNALPSAGGVPFVTDGLSNPPRAEPDGGE